MKAATSFAVMSTKNMTNVPKRNTHSSNFWGRGPIFDILVAFSDIMQRRCLSHS